MAKKAGVSASLLCRIENAQEKPSERVLKSYAAAFRMNFNELATLAGRVPEDVVKHLVDNPDAVNRIRAEMKEKQNG
jgi:transcriptional regulator with XRE-family HTH domain